MNIHIRPIVPSDYQAVTKLWNHELGNRMVTVQNLEKTLRQMAEREDYATFVASDGVQTLGFITTVSVLAAGFPSGYLKINGLAVDSAFQGKGIGKALVAQAEVLARDKGLSFIGLATGFQRTSAHAFYEKLGFESGSYWYNKML